MKGRGIDTVYDIQERKRRDLYCTSVPLPNLHIYQASVHE